MDQSNSLSRAYGVECSFCCRNIALRCACAVSSRLLQGLGPDFARKLRHEGRVVVWPQATTLPLHRQPINSVELGPRTRDRPVEPRPSGPHPPRRGAELGTGRRPSPLLGCPKLPLVEVTPTKQSELLVDRTLGDFEAPLATPLVPGRTSTPATSGSSALTKASVSGPPSGLLEGGDTCTRAGQRSRAIRRTSTPRSDRFARKSSPARHLPGRGRKDVDARESRERQGPRCQALRERRGDAPR